MVVITMGHTSDPQWRRPSNPNAPSNVEHRSKEALGLILSLVRIVSFVIGTWLAGASVFGFGIGDSWIVYPPRHGLFIGCVAVALCFLPVRWFLRRLFDTNSFNPVELSSIILAIVMSIAALLQHCLTYLQRHSIL